MWIRKAGYIITRNTTCEAYTDNSRSVHTRAADKWKRCTGHTYDTFINYEDPEKNVPFNKCNINVVPARKQ